MQTGWLNRVGAWTIEHVPCPDYAGPVDASEPAKGVMHTTEGSSIEGALAVFRKHYAPHFVVGRDLKHRVRVLQLLPLGRAASALEHPAGTQATNAAARVQIEIAGFSQHKLWKPDVRVLDALAKLVGQLEHASGIPCRHVANPQRDAGVWAHGSGWFGHDGVPHNEHWDPGQLDWGALFARATVGATSSTRPAPPAKPKPRPVVLHPQTWRLRRRANGLVYSELLDRPH